MRYRDPCLLHELWTWDCMIGHNISDRGMHAFFMSHEYRTAWVVIIYHIEGFMLSSWDMNMGMHISFLKYEFLNWYRTNIDLKTSHKIWMGLCQNIDLVYVHNCVNHFQYVESFCVITFLGYVMLLIIWIIFLVGKIICPDLQ